MQKKRIIGYQPISLTRYFKGGFTSKYHRNVHLILGKTTRSFETANQPLFQVNLVEGIPLLPIYLSKQQQFFINIMQHQFMICFTAKCIGGAV